MGFISNSVFKLLFFMLEGATLLFMFLYILGKVDFFRSEWKKVLFFIVSYIIFSSIAELNRQIPSTLFYMIFCILLLAYLTKTNLLLSILTNIIVFLIYGVTEMLSSIPVLYFAGMPVTEAIQDDQTKIKILMLVRPFHLAMIYLITKLRFSRSFFQKQIFRNSNSSTVYLIIILFFMSLYFNYIMMFMQDTLFLLASGLLFLCVFLLGIIDTMERVKLLNIESKLKLQLEYAKSMELLVDAVRKEKHDYQNHLSTLVALCTMNEPEAISQVRSYALRLTQNSYDSSGFRFYNTGNKYLDGLLAVKNNTAKSKGIFFEVDIEMPLENIEVDDVDLTTIIGNIIDNAFDAVSTNDEKDKKIVSLTTYEQDGKCCISISNNGPPISEVHKKHIFDYKYSTKSKADGERGYGLYIVKELITRNNGEITFESTDLETEFRVFFHYDREALKAGVSQVNTLQRLNQ